MGVLCLCVALAQHTHTPPPARSLSNFQSKWLKSSIVAHAAKQLGANDGHAVQLHCQWNQKATATGRLSSSNPNMQVQHHRAYWLPLHLNILLYVHHQRRRMSVG